MRPERGRGEVRARGAAGAWAMAVSAACAPTVGVEEAAPLVAPPAGCAPGEVATAAGCVALAPVEVQLTARKRAVLTPLALGGRAAWVADRAVSADEAARACEAVGAPPYLPREQPSLALGVGVAALVAAHRDISGVWTALRLDLDRSVAVGPDGEVAFAWRPRAVPMSGRPDLGQEARAQEAVEAAAVGEVDPDAPYCFALRADGALVVDRCSGTRMGVLCLAPDGS